MDIEDIDTWYDEHKEKYTVEARKKLKDIEKKYAYVATLPKGKKKEKALKKKLKKEEKLKKKFAKKLDKLNTAYEKKMQRRLNYNLSMHFFKHRVRMYADKIFAPIKDWWEMHHKKKDEKN